MFRLHHIWRRSAIWAVCERSEQHAEETLARCDGGTEHLVAGVFAVDGERSFVVHG